MQSRLTNPVAVGNGDAFMLDHRLHSIQIVFSSCRKQQVPFRWGKVTHHGIPIYVSSLRQGQVADNTIMIFTSDNGPTSNEFAKPYRGTKYVTFEGGHRVPCIASWPGKIAAGRVCDELTISLDIMPTMLAAARVKTPANHKLDGVNLLPALLDGDALEDRHLFWNGRAMRDARA